MAVQQNYINHVALVLDASGSMSSLISTVSTVADRFIQHLANRSKEMDQETRVTVYQFSGYQQIECLIYDKDVLRLPSIKTVYRSLGGMTALLDATRKAQQDLDKTAQLYGDHAFLTYVLTDGQENNSKDKDIRSLVNPKENWTLAIFVPDQLGVMEAKKFGFPPDNISVWSTTVDGTMEVGRALTATTDNYMTMRSQGVRGSKNLFHLQTEDLNITKVQDLMTKLGPGQFRFLRVMQKEPISNFVERMFGRPYKLGEAYYQLTKKETIQPQKAIALYDKKVHSVFTGPKTRKLLGLPDTYDVQVSPENHSQYDIYVQSTSTNRNLMPDTNLLVLS
jgi:hypothetical protein